MVGFRYSSVDNEEFSVSLDRCLTFCKFDRNMSVKYESVVRIETEILEYLYCDLLFIDQFVISYLVLFMC